MTEFQQQHIEKTGRDRANDFTPELFNDAPFYSAAFDQTHSLLADLGKNESSRAGAWLVLPQLELNGAAEKAEEKKFAEADLLSEGLSKSRINTADQLIHAAIAQSDPELAGVYSKSSEQFKERASIAGLSHEEQANTYEALAEMVDKSQTSCKLDRITRTMLALDFMFHAGNPSNIDQGKHGTCSAATIEQRMLTKYPSRVADLVRQVSIEGKWTAPDGKNIHIDDRSLLPGTEEQYHLPADGQRSLMSQIFQVTALNDLSQRGEISRYDGQILQYCQGVKDPDSDLASVQNWGEYLRDERSGEISEFYGLKGEAIQKELSRMSGETEPHVFVNIEKDGGRQQGVIHIDSEAKFLSELLKLKGSTQLDSDLPAIVEVNINREPFSENNHKRWNGHVVSISDLKQAEDGRWQLFLDNQWGENRDGWYPLSVIYEATRPLP